MTYALSIDWLSFFCSKEHGDFTPVEVQDRSLFGAWNWGYKKENHGTRQFKELWTITRIGEEVAEVQAVPCSPILKSGTCIVKFNNRLLYSKDLWEVVDKFMSDHSLKVENISRLDLCADFNRFYCYECIPFITDFLASRIRHKGRGVGSAFFNHYARVTNKVSHSRIDYTGLTFGTHKSDAHVYLYNKTFELLTQKDKPYIRDFWKAAGIDTTKPVWRLEVSLKSKARKFKNKTPKDGERDIIEVNRNSIREGEELTKIYHTFAKHLFSFVRNREGITNISREPLLQLFPPTAPYYDRAVIRNVSCSNRTTRILIKQLWQMADTYRGAPDDLVKDEGLTKDLAQTLAHSTDLTSWMIFKRDTWERPNLK